MPFVRLSPDDSRRYEASDFTLLCSACHFQHSKFRELKPERLPYWFTIAMKLRDYVPPKPEPLPQPKSKPHKVNQQMELL